MNLFLLEHPDICPTVALLRVFIREAVIHSQMNHSFEWNILSESATIPKCGLHGSFTNQTDSVL